MSKEKIKVVMNPSIDWLKWTMRDQYLPPKEREIKSLPKRKATQE